MEKRVFTFFVLSLLIWTSYLVMQLYLTPPTKKNPADAKQLASKQDEPREPAPKEPVAQEPPANKEPQAAPPAPQVARKLVTLGSLDPASGAPFLVTLDNRGGAILRLELNSPRYHDLDDLSGYLGHLELTKEERGCRVNVVGPGTPAALATSEKEPAGLRVGDHLVKLNGEAIRSPEAFAAELRKTKPGQSVEVNVLREIDGNTTELTYSVSLTRRPLELIRPEWNQEPQKANALVMEGSGPPSYRTTLTQLGDQMVDPRALEIASIPSLYDRAWEVKLLPDAKAVEFETQVTVGEKQALRFIKRFRLPEAKPEGLDTHHLTLEIKLENLGQERFKTAYRLEGPNGLPSEGWWYTNKVGPGWGAVGARDIAYFNDHHRLLGNAEIISTAEKQIKANNPGTVDLLLGNKVRDFHYLAVDTQYFASGLLPVDMLQAEAGSLPKFSVEAAFAQPLNQIQDKLWKKTTNVSFWVDAEAVELAPGESHSAQYMVFAGPKTPEVLATYHLSALNEYGWFGWVSKSLLAVLRGLHWATGNYGISIILLTVIVRLGLLPLGIRQAKSAAVMQQLAPELAKLKEKYANNLEEQAKAQRELFAKHGFNPMGGCFLMFLQLPIFIGLYRCLSVDIELREASLVKGWQWCSNLAGPDQLLRWKDWVWPYFSDEGNGWLGPYCNILPLITIVLFVVQQKMFSPPATDEETKMQQKIMTFMTFFMGVLFYKVPAGLCIYFITSSIWGICERQFLPKPKPNAPTTDPPENSPAPKKDEPSGPGSSFLNNLFNLADSELKASKKKQGKR